MESKQLIEYILEIVDAASFSHKPYAGLFAIKAVCEAHLDDSKVCLEKLKEGEHK